MKVSEIRDVVSDLPSSERAEIAAFILDSLEETHHWVDDEEVHKRSAEFDSGAEKGLTHDEFLKACGRT